MGDFDKYAGLFADQGEFDIPENYGLGIAVTPTPALTLALDWQRILYSDIPSVGNPVDSLFQGVPLGADDGPGFGWDDIDVFKLGASYVVDDRWTVRGGISHADQPIPGSQTFFNTLAPGVVQTHLTVGASYRFGDASEVSFSYMRAIEETVKGDGSIPPSFGGGEVDLTMSQNSFGVAFSRKF
jgi:long-chain fatty acid transport protein